MHHLQSQTIFPFLSHTFRGLPRVHKALGAGSLRPCQVPSEWIQWMCLHSARAHPPLSAPMLFCDILDQVPHLDHCLLRYVPLHQHVLQQSHRIVDFPLRHLSFSKSAQKNPLPSPVFPVPCFRSQKFCQFPTLRLQMVTGPWSRTSSLLMTRSIFWSRTFSLK
jgi:hypothetical protein